MGPVFPNLCRALAPTAWPDARPRRGRGDQRGGAPRPPAFLRLKVLNVAPSSAPGGGVLGRLAPNLEVLSAGHSYDLAPVLEGLGKLTALLFEGYGESEIWGCALWLFGCRLNTESPWMLGSAVPGCSRAISETCSSCLDMACH